MFWNPSAAGKISQFLQMNSQLHADTSVTGILQHINTLTEEGDLAFCATLVTLTNGQVMMKINNFTDSPYTLKKDSHVANFTVLTPEQMKHVRTIDPVVTWHLLQEIPENAAFYATSSIKSTKPEDFKEDYCFLTPEDPGDPQFHFPIQKRILKELQKTFRIWKRSILKTTLSRENNFSPNLIGPTLCSNLNKLHA